MTPICPICNQPATTDGSLWSPYNGPQFIRWICHCQDYAYRATFCMDLAVNTNEITTFSIRLPSLCFNYRLDINEWQLFTTTAKEQNWCKTLMTGNDYLSPEEAVNLLNRTDKLKAFS